MSEGKCSAFCPQIIIGSSFGCPLVPLHLHRFGSAVLTIKMETLSLETCCVILEFTVGPKQDMESIRALVLSWQDLGSLAVASKKLSKHARAIIGTRHPSAVDLFYQACKTRQTIKKEVRLEQLSNECWNAIDRQCAVCNCSVETGIWVPWHRGRGEYAPHEKNYRGAYAVCSESSAASIDGQMLVARWIQEHGPCLVVCSVGCHDLIRNLVHRWPDERFPSHILRGADYPLFYLGTIMYS